MTRDDARKILGVTKTATAAALKTAWRRRCHETHPDTGGTPEAFRAVQDAYALLMTPEPAVRTSHPKWSTWTTTSSVNHRCRACGGRGYMEFHHGFTTVHITCMACGGQ
jgi:DnaJ-class molecular chaperone